MRLILGLLVIAPLALLVVGAVRGRVRVTSCCALPAEHDARMASAYDPHPRSVVAHDAQTIATDGSAH